MGYLAMSTTASSTGAVPKGALKQEVCDPAVRWRKVYFGRPILQQKWRLLSEGRWIEEWRDVPKVEIF
jgi:hypothetical protein